MTRQQLALLGQDLETFHDFTMLELDDNRDVLTLRGPQGIDFELELEDLTGRWHELELNMLTLRELATKRYIYRWPALKVEGTVLPTSVANVVAKVVEKT